MRIKSDICLGMIVGALMVILLGAVVQTVQQQNEYAEAADECVQKLISDGVPRNNIMTLKGKCYLGAE